MNNIVVLYQTENVLNKFSFESWSKYCNKHNLKLFEFTYKINEKLDQSNQIFYFYKILEANNLTVDNILFVSDTTLIKTDVDNIFNITKNKLTFAEWDSDFNYLFNNIEIYNKHFFKKENVDFTRFFDLGFFIVNNSHKFIFDNVVSFLENNYQELTNKLDTTFIPQNFFFECDYNKLPYTYNMIDMMRKEIVFDDSLKKLGNIFNFKNINNKEKIMETVIKSL